MKINNRISDPFSNIILDDEEQLIEQAIERGEYQDNPDFANSKKILESSAKQYTELNTTKPVTLRIKQIDLIKLKARAKIKNIPYQTLLGVLINDYVEGNKTLKL